VRQIKLVQNNKKKWLHVLIGKHFCMSKVNTELQSKLKGGLFSFHFIIKTLEITTRHAVKLEKFIAWLQLFTSPLKIRPHGESSFGKLPVLKQNAMSRYFFKLKISLLVSPAVVLSYLLICIFVLI